MIIFAWLLRLLFFLAVLWFALKNTMPVTVRLTESWQWHDVPLVLVILGSLVLGMVLGAMALAPRLYRLHRRAAVADGAQRRPHPAPAADAALGSDQLASVARRAGAVAEFDSGEAGAAAPRR
jgi:uncharacterized integral membrane protein